MICITISLISQLVLFCEHPFFHLLCFLPFLHDVALSIYLVMLGCVFIFVLVSTVTFLRMLSYLHRLWAMAQVILLMFILRSGESFNEGEVEVI